MKELFVSPVFCLSLSIAGYAIGSKIHKKTGSPLANPLLIAAALVGALLLAADIPVAEYYAGSSMINFFILPSTAALGTAIYRNLPRIRKNLIPVLGGCAVGALTALVSVVGLCRLFGLDATLTASLAPKSVTTAIATSVSAQYGGIVPVTVFAVCLTGVFGAVAAPLLIKLFRVKDPVEAGLAIGAASHAVGTSTAVKLGETEGAMSGVAMGLCGVFTVLFALFLPYVL